MYAGKYWNVSVSMQPSTCKWDRRKKIKKEVAVMGNSFSSAFIGTPGRSMSSRRIRGGIPTACMND
jgi:hypothetical protein